MRAWADRVASIVKSHTAPAAAVNTQAAHHFLSALDQRLPLPEQTIFLRPLVAAVWEAQLSLVGDADEEERARLLNNLSGAYNALGRREEALAATQEAVDIRRELAQQNRAAFLPDLAMSLNNLGTRLSALGRRQEALAATQEAVEHYRQLAQQNRAAFLPDLAGSLNNLGLWLADQGRRQEALAATQEAVDIRRELAQQNRAAFLPDLARGLNNLGDRLSEADQQAEALSAYEEAVRTLAPFFLRLPTAFTRMGYMVDDYVKACETAGCEPDMALLAPVVEILQRLQAQDGG